MEEEWVKVKEILRVNNIVKQKTVIEFIQKDWKEILDQYKIKYKLEFVQDTEYVNGKRSIDKVYILNLYTTKEYLQQMKTVIIDYENAQLEIPEELREIDEESVEDENEGLQPVKFSKYFFNFLIILLIIFEVVVMLISEKSSDNKPAYVIMTVLIIVELYSIVSFNKKKRKDNNE